MYEDTKNDLGVFGLLGSLVLFVAVLFAWSGMQSHRQHMTEIASLEDVDRSAGDVVNSCRLDLCDPKVAEAIFYAKVKARSSPLTVGAVEGFGDAAVMEATAQAARQVNEALEKDRADHLQELAQAVDWKTPAPQSVVK
jgi:hypothetical protein